MTVTAAGCYRTLELPSLDPVPDTRIVADITPVGAEEMAPWIGADASGLEAVVLRWGDTEAELAVLRVDHRGTRSIQWNQERVVFPVATLRNVRERRLDTARTAAFVGGVTTVATALAIAFVRFVGSNGGDGNGGGTDPPQ